MTYMIGQYQYQYPCDCLARILPRAPNLIYHIFVKAVYTLKSIIIHKNKNETKTSVWN